MKRVLGSSRRYKIRQPYTLHNSVEWTRSGRQYFDRLLELIDSAKHEIHIQTYIFDSDNTGNQIADGLIRAAKRNVQVFLLVDAFGSKNLSSETIINFKKAGINFRKFGELYSNGRFHIGRRLHHKVSVFDGDISIVGGINISDNYNDTTEGKAWLDFAVIMYGNISRRLQYICRRQWGGFRFSFNARKKLLKNTVPEQSMRGYSPVRIRRNDFILNRNDIAISYRDVLRRSKKSILLVGGYFLPGGRTRRLMRSAIKRGVKIELLVAEKSDVKVVVLARQYLYAWLIRNGIHVYEYKPSNVHGKVIISDEVFTSIGSYDLNNLSTYSNIELNVDINDENFSSKLASYIKEIMLKDCNKLDGENMYKNKSLLSKFSMWFSYRFIKTFFVLSLLLAGKREKKF